MNLRRLPALALGALLAACTAGGPARQPTPVRAVAGVCHIGPHGGPLTADRGIGGTGISGEESADRGIGGTGINGEESADRGIGGTGIANTGILGVITGFGSVCVDGLEVSYDPTVPVQIGGNLTSTDALRVGQVVAITATSSASGLQARHMSVRTEVSGPVESIGKHGAILVAGQQVVLSGRVFGDANVVRGAWIAVSGIKRQDGAVVATRIDPSPAGRITVHGVLTARHGTYRIGLLPVRLAAGVGVKAGQYVTASGYYKAGTLLADRIVPDGLAINPFSYFGPDVSRLFIESYITAEDHRLLLPHGLTVPLAPGFVTSSTQRLTAPSWRSVVQLVRQPDGVTQATSLRDVAGTVSMPATPTAGPIPPVFGPANGPEDRIPARLALPGKDEPSHEVFTPAPVPSPDTLHPHHEGGLGASGPGSAAGRPPLSSSMPSGCNSLQNCAPPAGQRGPTMGSGMSGAGPRGP